MFTKKVDIIYTNMALAIYLGHKKGQKSDFGGFNITYYLQVTLKKKTF